MLAIWVKVRVKPEARERFLKAIEADALGSERDEPGCLRFNVLGDRQDPNVYYFYEVYRDEAALEAHRAAPHYAVWRAAVHSHSIYHRRYHSVADASRFQGDQAVRIGGILSHLRFDGCDDNIVAQAAFHHLNDGIVSEGGLRNS